MRADQRTILLVEDNEDDEIMTLRSLKRSNLANPVIVARDGQEALDYLFGQGAYAGRDVKDLPQVVLLDLKLPKLSGLQVLEQIRNREETRLLPVVILTSSDEEQDMVESYRLGGNSYVRKPVAFSGLSDSVQQLGLYWLLINKTPGGR
ncbi:MAG TPA: response regulator [bacterium]|nr:response regulator [bacterium]